MNTHISMQPTKRTELGQKVLTDLNSRQIGGTHVAAFATANSRLADAHYAAQSADRDPRFANVTIAVLALFAVMKALRKALMLSGISEEGHFSDFGVVSPSALSRKVPAEQVQQCRLLIADIKQLPDQPDYVTHAVKDALRCVGRLETASDEVKQAQGVFHNAKRALQEAQLEWTNRYQLLRGWLTLADREHGTHVAQEVFPRQKRRAPVGEASPPEVKPAVNDAPEAITGVTG